MSLCPICERGAPADVIHELSSVWVTAGARAPLPGYVCVVAKRHVEEPYELPSEQRALFWDEALQVAEAVARVVSPKKMNYEIHGNTIRHLHLHLFPRFEGDPFEGSPIDAARLGFSRTDEDLQSLRRAIVEHDG